jgi:hypothetical protein
VPINQNVAQYPACRTTLTCVRYVRTCGDFVPHNRSRCPAQPKTVPNNQRLETYPVQPHSLASSFESVSRTNSRTCVLHHSWYATYISNSHIWFPYASPVPIFRLSITVRQRRDNREEEIKVDARSVRTGLANVEGYVDQLIFKFVFTDYAARVYRTCTINIGTLPSYLSTSGWTQASPWEWTISMAPAATNSF